MLLAELEVFHSRPIAPTRRVALGVTVLPTSPAPGFGGLLLGGIVAAFVEEVDPELLDDLTRLTHQLEAGQRIPQPRLRHRFQDDRVGLTAHRHRLLGDGEQLTFDLGKGLAEPNVLGAVYAASRVDQEHRPAMFAAIRRGLRWRGEIGPQLVEHLSDSRVTTGWATLGGRDPVVWALGILGLTPDGQQHDEVQKRFRTLLMAAHPDHGGAAEGAAQRISDLTEARRILLHG
ncbi:hypothetical protein KSP35_10365 [Aquihabitans sp. G128]|uniref:J domain-containing protein n=1 Tax=Aquihabitans sp. G128 TaxID=2849779 RepID=UPI001C20F770|nr:J domain-containing protein [Aquihabitans sp. G128]QXC63145.1 hypothetical protein KSP35_10365 [Aquihabitans sp. G128]